MLSLLSSSVLQIWRKVLNCCHSDLRPQILPLASKALWFTIGNIVVHLMFISWLMHDTGMALVIVCLLKVCFFFNASLQLVYLCLRSLELLQVYTDWSDQTFFFFVWLLQLFFMNEIANHMCTLFIKNTVC